VQLQFDSTCSLHAPGETQLTDDSVVAVRSEPTARVDDTDDEGPVVTYDGAAPLVAASGNVVGFGAIMVDGSGNFPADNEEFVLNVWDEFVGSGTVLWDEGHDQFFDTDEVSAFPSYAEDHGYLVEGTSSLVDDLDGADAVVVTSPSQSFSSAELDALVEFADDGGAVFLHSQSDYNDFDGTQIHNEIAAALDVDFRFSDTQVFDDDNNGGAPFVPTTRNFTDSFPGFFAGRSGIDGTPVKTSERCSPPPTPGRSSRRTDCWSRPSRSRSTTTNRRGTPSTASSGTSSTRTPTARRDCSIANSSSKGTLACTGPGSRGIESSG